MPCYKARHTLQHHALYKCNNSIKLQLLFLSTLLSREKFQVRFSIFYWLSLQHNVTLLFVASAIFQLARHVSSGQSASRSDKNTDSRLKVIELNHSKLHTELCYATHAQWHADVGCWVILGGCSDLTGCEVSDLVRRAVRWKCAGNLWQTIRMIN